MKRAVLVLVVALCGVAHAAPDPARIDRAADRVLDSRFQEAETGYRDDRERDRDFAERDRPRGGGFSGGSAPTPGGPGALSPIFAMLMWALLIAGAIVLIFYVVKELSKGRNDRVRAADPGFTEEPVPIEAELDRPLEDADALARQGKFAEAIHTLLLRTFQELAKASQISPHLTSREILAKIPLLGDGRDALGQLVAVVELTWFGDDVPGEPEWLRCRALFDRFVAIHRASITKPGARPEGAAA